METMDYPYQSPAAQPPPMPRPPDTEPTAVKVFGVIHLVFAGLGFLGGAWNLASPFFSGLFLDPKNPAYATQIKMQAELQWVTLMTGVFAITLAVLLLISGLKLVNSKPEGVKWSNRYAWTSIAMKIVSLAVSIGWVLPITQAMMREMMAPAGLPGAAKDTMTSAMSGMAAVTSVLTPILSCIYPILALYFLSRPPVKAWRAARLASDP